MNEKTAKQIKEMMSQTIGVEVEMNSITRAKAAQIAAAPGQPGTQTAESGNSKRTSAFTDRTVKSAN